jgi:hypothetical protein
MLSPKFYDKPNGTLSPKFYDKPKGTLSPKFYDKPKGTLSPTFHDKTKDTLSPKFYDKPKGTLSPKFSDQSTYAAQQPSQLHHGKRTKPRTVRTVSDTRSRAPSATAAATLLLSGSSSVISLAKTSNQIIYKRANSIQLAGSLI